MSKPESERIISLLPADLENITFEYWLSFNELCQLAESLEATSSAIPEETRVELQAGIKAELDRRVTQLPTKLAEQKDLFGFIQEQGLMKHYNLMHKVRVFCEEKKHTSWQQIKVIENLAAAKDYCLYALTILDINKLDTQLLEDSLTQIQEAKPDQETVNALDIIQILLSKARLGWQVVESQLITLLCVPDRQYYINISGASFTDLTLRKKVADETMGANFNGAYAIETDFSDCDLYKASFIDTWLTKARFNYNSYLQEVYFSTDKCEEAIFRNVAFDYTKFSGKEPLYLATIENCIFLETTNFSLTKQQIKRNIVRSHLQENEEKFYFKNFSFWAKPIPNFHIKQENSADDGIELQQYPHSSS